MVRQKQGKRLLSAPTREDYIEKHSETNLITEEFTWSITPPGSKFASNSIVNVVSIISSKHCNPTQTLGNMIQQNT